jgi:dephospho-CoA kinase
MILGLTGGIACGKSEAAKYFAKCGCFIIDADAVSREIVDRADILKKLEKIFGPSIISNGKLNRKKLAGIIFNDSVLRKKCEAVLHKPILNKIYSSISHCAPDKIIIVDAPLLFETGLDKICGKTVVVWAKPSLQKARLKKRNMSYKDFCRRQASQMPMELKMQKADFVIDNSHSKQYLERCVKELLREVGRGKIGSK